MNTLLTFISPDVAVLLINVMGQSAVILTIALLVERAARRYPTIRHAVLLCGLIGALAIPCVVLLEQRLGLVFMSLPIDLGTTLPIDSDDVDHLVAEHRTESPRVRSLPMESPAKVRGAEQPPPRLSSSFDEPARSEFVGSPREPSIGLAGAARLLLLALACVWIIGAAACAFRVLTASFRLRSLRRHASVIDRPVLTSALALVQQVWKGKLPDIFASSHLRTPLSAGIRRPYVVLPQHAVDSLSPSELRDVLLHECAHIQRRDVVVLYLQRLSTVLFWPNPLLHRLNRLLDTTREDICDNYVIAVGDAVAYSRTLLTLSRQSSDDQAFGLATSLLPARRKLEERIRDLLDERRKPVTHIRPSVVITIALSFACLAVCTAAIRSTAKAQEKPARAAEALRKFDSALKESQIEKTLLKFQSALKESEIEKTLLKGRPMPGAKKNALTEFQRDPTIVRFRELLHANQDLTEIDKLGNHDESNATFKKLQYAKDEFSVVIARRLIDDGSASGFTVAFFFDDTGNLVKKLGAEAANDVWLRSLGTKDRVFVWVQKRLNQDATRDPPKESVFTREADIYLVEHDFPLAIRVRHYANATSWTDTAEQAAVGSFIAFSNSNLPEKDRTAGNAKGLGRDKELHLPRLTWDSKQSQFSGPGIVHFDGTSVFQVDENASKRFRPTDK